MPRLPFAELFRRFFGVLEGLGVDYFAYGGVAVAVWGDPRETQDVDAVVIVDSGDCDRVLRAFREGGFHIPQESDSLFPIDGWLRAAMGGRYGDIALGRTPFDDSARSRRTRKTMFDSQVWVASAEDLVLHELVAYRHKDLADAHSILWRQRRTLDLDYLRRWADEIARRTNKFEVPSKLEELLTEIRCA